MLLEQSGWEDFELKHEDIELLYELILEKGKPLPLEELVLALVERAREKQKEKLAKLEEEGLIYRPSNSYKTGQEIFFPSFGFARATVLGVRPGYNPDYGEFEVIKVKFSDGGEVKEFASSLKKPHKLDQETLEDWLARYGIDINAFVERYGHVIGSAITRKLSSEEEFVSFGNLWFLRALMPEIHEGHLNIAEAAIEVAQRPLSPTEILKHLELPSSYPTNLQIFSLNIAMAQDKRFSQVGPKGQPMWFLRRFEPPEVAQESERLVYLPLPYKKEALARELVEIILKIEDEATEWDSFLPSVKTGDNVTIALPYHHLRAGTLPITPRTAPFFPEGESDVTLINFIDGVKGEKFYGWALHARKYVAGLKDWYEKIGAMAGTYITLTKGRGPTEVIVRYTPRRIKKDWVKVARVQNERLTFEIQLRQLTCDFDELMMIVDGDREKIDAIKRKLDASARSLYEVLVQIFPELLKLSPQGTVHFLTLYTAVNFIKRCPPAPLLAELNTHPCFIYKGSGYWSFDESKI
ncbi:MAG: hypothetical protein RMK30_03010 [Anaerolineae bacterium]|nr:hypothetical protein [Anaerolineae bacterium]MDW8101825.1 hypothetical protein [Anaerolineae bacterium]